MIGPATAVWPNFLNLSCRLLRHSMVWGGIVERIIPTGDGAGVQKSTAARASGGTPSVRDQSPMMTPLTLSLTRAHLAHEQPCAVCGAEFVPAEDSGSRLLSLMPADQEPFGVLMCGGCHSKWSHGVTVTIRRRSEAPLVPVVRHPGSG